MMNKTEMTVSGVHKIYKDVCELSTLPGSIYAPLQQLNEAYDQIFSPLKRGHALEKRKPAVAA